MRFTILIILLFPILFMSTVLVFSFDAVEETSPMTYTQNPEEMPGIEKLSMSRGGYMVPKYFEIVHDESGYTMQFDLYEDAVFHTLTPEAMEKVSSVISKYNVRSWDGFDKVDRFALDGEGFYLYITFSDGSRISANGSNMFPKNYREVFRELEAILEDESSYQQ